MRYKYAVDDELDDFYTVESTWSETHLEYLVEDCAEDFHCNHDGWEYSWPIKFTLAREDGTVLGVFEVEREHRPSFSASKIKEEA